MRGSSCLLLVFAASCTCGREISGSACDSSNPCVQSTFSQATGKCVDVPAPDGTACDAGLECLANTRCAAGTCVGEARSCDDQNACTQDSCVEGEGCQHTTIQCEPDDPCQIYACNPNSGCYDTGSTLADGTTCQLWWEPCVDDAACSGGTCDSPTADAERPGQVRWQVPLGQWASGPFTVDDAGASTFIGAVNADVGYQVIAIDACGKVRWQSATNIEPFALMQDRAQLVAMGDVAGDPVIEGLDPASGAVRWSSHLLAAFADAGLDVGNCLSGPSLAESNQGQILVLVSACGPDAGPMNLVALDQGGTIEWIRAAPLPWYSVGPALDEAGNIYLYGPTALDCDGGSPPAEMLWSVSPEGATLFQQVLPIWTPLGLCERNSVFPFGPDVSSRQIAIGKDGIVVQHGYQTVWVVDGGYPSGGYLDDQEGSGLLVSFDGGVIASLPLTNFSVGNGTNFFTPVVDSDGDIFIPGVLWDAGPAGVSSIEPDGDARWTSSALGTGSLALSDDGLLFGIQGNPTAGVPATLVAVDTDAGGIRWSAEASSPIVADFPTGVALTPSASVITILDGTDAVAFFAGKRRPSMTAPWSRWGGDNSNRSSAR